MDTSQAKLRKAIIDGTVDLARVDPVEITCQLRVAVAKNDTQFATAILDQVPDLLQLHDNGGGRTLWQALEHGNEILARKLIFEGADLNYRSRNGSSFLHTFMGKFEALAAFMIERGANTRAKNSAGHSVFFAAVRDGLKSVVKAIAQLDIFHDDEDRAYKEAVKNDDMAALLPILVKSSDLLSRLTRIKKVMSGYLEVRTRDKVQLNLIKQILDASLLPDYSEFHIIEILKAVVIHKDHANVAKLVLSYLERLDGKSEEVAVLLCCTVKYTQSSMSMALIEKGAGVNQCNMENEYPLHFACYNKSLQNLHLLLSLGANLSVTNKRGKTPLAYLALDPFREQHKLLLRHYAVRSMKKLTIHEQDMAIIQGHPRMKAYYEECMLELWSMKVTRIHDDVTFFCFFSENLDGLCALARKLIFLRTYYLNQKEGSVTFPYYSRHIHLLFKMAVEKKNALLELERMYEEVALRDPPYGRVDPMVYSTTTLDDFERKFYFRLHERIHRKERNYGVHLLH